MDECNIGPFNVVALMEALPEHGLQRGQVGAVVDELGPGVFEIEFVDPAGHTFQMLPLRADQLMVLHYEKTAAA